MRLFYISIKNQHLFTICNDNIQTDREISVDYELKRDFCNSNFKVIYIYMT